MSWISPDYKKRQERKALEKVTHDAKPVIRERVRSVDVDPKSGYPPSQCTHGFVEIIQLRGDELMRERMALSFFHLKCDLEDWTKHHHPGASLNINAPEVFPVDMKQCLVLVTGWISETIILTS